jgi:hypothetical protein
MADLNKPAFYPRVGNITPKPRAPLAQTEVREQPLDPVMQVFKNLMDRSSEMLDKSKSTPFDVTKGLIGAIPFHGERFAKDFDQSTMPVPTGFGLLPKASPEGLDTSGMGMQSVRVPTKEALNEMKWSDLVGTAGASRMFEALGQNRTPEFFDALDAATLGLGGLSAARAAPKIAKAVGEGAKTVGMGGLEMIDRGMFGEGPLRNFVPQHKMVVKEPNGNWQKGSVEKVLDPLIQKGIINNVNIPYGPEFDAAALKRIEELKLAASQPDYTGGAGRVAEHLERDINNPRRANEAAMNKWIQSNLTNYVKKDMGTPDDPVRKLADEGISHLPTDAGMPLNMSAVRETRKEAGFPDPYGKSWQGLLWESKADKPIGFGTAGEMINRGKGEPWMEKVDPFTRVHGISPMDSVNFTQDLGFNHIVDVLRQDVASGRIRPEQLNKVSMEQAVRRTHEYDQEMAKKMRETALQQQEGFPVHKEYPEGYKWIELTNPKTVPKDYALPEGMKLDTIDHPRYGLLHTVSDPKGITQIEATDSPENALLRFYNRKGGEGYKTLEDALKYEGDTMGHCVGGYCPDVVAGNSRIFSLRDSKGEPHVTIETSPEPHPIGTTARGNEFPHELKYGTIDDNYSQIPKEKEQEIYNLGKQLHQEKGGDAHDRFQEAANTLLGPRSENIVQIKGKQNRAPKEDYIPYVQDFVKGGKWSSIGDLRNADMYGMHSKPDVVEKYGRPWITQQEYDDWLLNELKPTKPPEVPPAPEGMKRGGVAISSNPDTMMLELGNQKMKNGVPAYSGAGAIAKLVRAAPKTAAEIDAIARRMAPQLLGEFVRGDAGTQSVAGKTQKQFAKEKEMKHDIRPTGAERPLPKTVDVEDLKDQVMIGISGDPTISGQTLHGLNGVPLESPSPQHGGPLYGLGRDEEFWASGLGAANRVQNLAREAGKQYDMPVLGKYIMMGPESINYAQHYADANLSAINPAKMSKGQIESFNNLVREGYPYTKNKERFQRVFPAFPGIENPSEAYLHFSIDPELRKHFNALMQMPTVTEKHGMPSGVDVRHAITEPDLRNLETGVTGKSIGRMRPEVTQLGLSEHPTYSHDIPGEFMGSSKYPIPYELSFPDTVKAIRENPKQAPHEFGSLKMIGPRQVIDQQMIDEIKQYQEMIKKYTGQKKGGAVHKAEGGAITGDDLILEERPL